MIALPRTNKDRLMIAPPRLKEDRFMISPPRLKEDWPIITPPRTKEDRPTHLGSLDPSSMTSQDGLRHRLLEWKWTDPMETCPENWIHGSRKSTRQRN